MQALPSEDALLRLADIIGQKAITAEEAEANRKAGRGIRRPRPSKPALIPVSASTWWNGVRSGKYPKPVKIGDRTTCWRWRDIRPLVEGGQA